MTVMIGKTKVKLSNKSVRILRQFAKKSGKTLMQELEASIVFALKPSNEQDSFAA